VKPRSATASGNDCVSFASAPGWHSRIGNRSSLLAWRGSAAGSGPPYLTGMMTTAAPVNLSADAVPAPGPEEVGEGDVVRVDTALVTSSGERPGPPGSFRPKPPTRRLQRLRERHRAAIAYSNPQKSLSRSTRPRHLSFYHSTCGRSKKRHRLQHNCAPRIACRRELQRSGASSDDGTTISTLSVQSFNRTEHWRFDASLRRS